MERFLRVVLIGVLVVVVAGVVASATPGLNAHRPQGTVSLIEESSSTPVPSETPDPSETPEPSGTQGVDPSGAGAPDFSACVGLTHLENAICRHEAKLAVDPTNAGVAKALGHLQTNLAKKQAHDAARASDSSGGGASSQGNGGSPSGGSGGSHGKSALAPGQSKD